jgi:hypothetical protein
MHHAWRRYWSRWDGALDGPGSGFFPELDSAIPLHFRPRYRTSKELADIPCLVLVGEPGIGKSTEVEDERCRLIAAGEFGSVEEIEETIFVEPSSAVSPITVFLDSIDEGRIAIENLLAPLRRILRRRLGDGSTRAGVRIRVTCRSQEWPKPLGDELVAIYGEENVGFWHLCPLQRSDAAIAAKSRGLDSENFLDQIATARAEPLAAKPVTLKLLFRISEAKGSLPSKQSEVYKSGLAALCLDPNEWRREEGQERHVGRLGKDQRLAIARRIAALSVVCQRPFVQRRETPDLPGVGALSLEELCASPASEPMGTDKFTFGAGDVREVLDCGLFRGAGDGRVTWTHLTYGEFLAAEYFAEHGISHEQIDNILRSPGESRIAPQMREVAAWLSSLLPEYGRGLVEENPDVLIRSDIVVVEDGPRLQLAASYLDKINRREIDYRSREEFLPRLAGQGLAEVLKPYIAGSCSNEDARLAAIEMAGACRCQEIEADLIAMALDEAHPNWLRTRAVRQLSLVNVAGDRRSLRPLLGERDDELRTAAIDLLWPGNISTAEMLAAVKPLRTAVLGFHNMFIRDRLIQLLASADLPLALEWMTQLIRRYPEPTDDFAEHGGDERFQDLMILCQKLYHRAVDESDDERIMDELVSFADVLLEFHRWRNYPTFDGNEYRTDWKNDDVRRRFVAALIKRRPGSPHLFYEISSLNAISAADLDWLLAWLDKESHPALRGSLAEVSVHTFDIHEAAQYETILSAADRHPEFAKYRTTLQPYVELGSPYAGFLQREYAHRNCVHSPAQRPCPSAEEVRKETGLYLEAIERGDASMWWRLAWFLSNDPEQGHGRLYDGDMDSWWAWQHLTKDDRARVIDAAWVYILSAELPGADWWTKPGVGDYRVIFGHLALDHFLKTDPASLGSLPHAVWERWAPGLLYVVTNNPEVESRSRSLVARCYAAVPETMVLRTRERLRMLVSSSSHHVEFRKILRDVWDGKIAAAVADTVACSAIDDFSLEEGVSLLLEHGDAAGETLLRDAIDGKETGTRRAVILATGIRRDEGRHWSRIWPLIKSNPTLGMQVLDTAINDNFLGEMTELSAQDLAELYLFLDTPTPAEELRSQYIKRRSPPWFLPSMINYLITQGNEEACNALTHIRDSGPEMDWASRAIIQCRENLRSHTWRAPEPGELLAVIENADRRFVQDGDDLLRLLIASLARYRQTLPIEDLWNTRPRYTPKSEKALSDHIIRHLRQDLRGRALVANREVDIDSYGTGAETERVDILVEAFIGSQKEDVVRVVIEVKGCWNRDLLTSMATQLADGYLTGNGIPQGIYLVGWFLCPRWKEPDSGRAATAKRWNLDLDGANRKFEEQAAQLSRDGRQISAFLLDARWPE